MAAGRVGCGVMTERCVWEEQEGRARSRALGVERDRIRRREVSLGGDYEGHRGSNKECSA